MSIQPRPWDLLCQRIIDQRKEKLLAVVAQRTQKIRLVIQDIHHPHNISACLRSADAFGLESVDIVTLREKFSPSTVAKGVAHWMRMHRWETVDSCALHLKSQGYKIAAGYPGKSSFTLETLPIDAPIAVVFANEHAGAAPEWLAHVDYPFTISMSGMVESLNISVSCAITLYTLRQRLLQRLSLAELALTVEQQESLLDHWAQYFL